MLPTNFISKLTQKAYEYFGSTYTHTAKNQFKALLPHIDQFTADFKKEKTKVLDIGCGPGLLLEYLMTQGFKYLLGIDISDREIEEAVKRVPAHMLLRQDFHQMHFNEEEFSVVFAINSLHYTNKKAFKAILKNIYYFSTKEMKFFLVMPQGNQDKVTEEYYIDPESGRPRQHAVYLSYYEEEELRAMLKEVDFEVLELKSFSHPSFSTPLFIINARKTQPAIPAPRGI